MGRRRRRYDGKRSRGAAMTEAAIVSPVFFALLFGVIEMAFLFRDKLTLINATRDSTRTAAAAGPDPDADWRILQTIKQTYPPSIRGSIVRIVVFKATSVTSQPTAACASGTATAGECNVYGPSDMDLAVGAFNCPTTPTTSLDAFWCPTTGYSRDTRLSSLGYVGVQIVMNHNYITGFFGTQRQMKETIVFRFEPRTSA